MFGFTHPLCPSLGSPKLSCVFSAEAWVSASFRAPLARPGHGDLVPGALRLPRPLLQTGLALPPPPDARPLSHPVIALGAVAYLAWPPRRSSRVIHVDSWGRDPCWPSGPTREKSTREESHPTLTPTHHLRASPGHPSSHLFAISPPPP